VQEENFMDQETAIIRDTLTLKVEDGTSMAAYLARPDDKNMHPGIIVLQEAFGVNSNIRSVANRLAEQGYVAIAPELYHRTAPGFEGDYKDFASALPHARAVNVANAEADLRATFAWLHTQPSVVSDQIFSVGFCMGGKISFLANSLFPLRAAISFYGGGIAPDLLDRAATLNGPMLLIWGGLDKHINQEHRLAVTAALQAQGKTFVNVEFSNADHGFFCDERSAYQPQAARQSWELMLEFLRS
jgi:carboxymethylenebutenolidase